MSEQDMNSEVTHPAAKKQKFDDDNSRESTIMTRKQAELLKNFNPSAISPFSYMPDEVVEHILSFLDRKSLLNSALVDTRWSDIIKKSRKIMKKLPLAVYLSKGARNEELKKLKRRYQTVKIISCNQYTSPAKYVTSQLKKIGGHVKTFCYKNGNATVMLEMLRCFPSIENIQTDNTWFPPLPERFDRSVFAQIKTLKATNSNNIIPYFDDIQLIKCELIKSDSNRNEVVRFLSNQTLLRNLKLNLQHAPSFVLPLQLLKCQVRVFHLSGSGLSRDSEDYRNFMNLFSSSVFDLKIDSGFQNRTFFRLLPVLSNFESLKKLQLCNVILPLEGNYQHLAINVNSLTVRNVKFQTVDQFKQFFAMFNNSVVDLRVHSFDCPSPIKAEIIRNVTAEMKKVKFLTVRRFHHFQNATFENLRGLKLSKHRAGEEKIDWPRIFDNNQNLKSIHIQIKQNGRNFSLKKLLTASRSSTTIKVTGDFKLNKKRLEIIKEKASLGIRLQIEKSNLKMPEEKFEEIMGEHKNLIQFL